MTSLAEIKQQIHDLEYSANGMFLLNNAGVSVRNLKRVRGGYKADIVLFIEDIKERYNNCEYPDKVFNFDLSKLPKEE